MAAMRMKRESFVVARVRRCARAWPRLTHTHTHYTRCVWQTRLQHSPPPYPPLRATPLPPPFSLSLSFKSGPYRWKVGLVQ